MTVAFDAVTAATAFTTTDPFTFSHTPVGTPRAVVVTIAHGTDTDLVDSTVSYGGVTMARIDSASQAAGDDPGRTYVYFLGASIPTGTQTVSIDHTGAATSKKASCLTLTAAADTEVVTFNTLTSGAAANPQIALDTGAVSSLRVAVILSGIPSSVSITALAAFTGFGLEDFGNFLTRSQYQTTAASGSVTTGWTAASDDVAMVAVAVQEVQAVVAAPYPYIGGGYYPTEG